MTNKVKNEIESKELGLLVLDDAAIAAVSGGGGFLMLEEVYIQPPFPPIPR